MSWRDRLRTLFRLTLLFAVLVAIALASAIATIRLTIRGHQATMPNLVGMPVEAAQRVARGLGVELKVEDKLFSTQYPASQIVSQMPPQGTRVKEGQHIHVLVSLGPPQITVPNLIGASIRAARITAVQRGLTVGDVAAVHWPGAEPDQVVVQDPPPLTSEVHSPAVNFLVSLGPPSPAFLCPSFIGQTITEARRTTEKARFRVGEVTGIPTDAISKGVILSQSPQPGSKIGPDVVFTFQMAE